jgi:hypothetical protein
VSHVADINMIVKSIPALEKAAARLGGTLVEAETYEWWGSHVGDYPLPDDLAEKKAAMLAEGQAPADVNKWVNAELSRCSYKISFPGVPYEVGVLDRQDGTYTLRWDFINSQLLRVLGGEKAPLMIQAYAIECGLEQARLRGHYNASEQVLPDGTIELVINT